MSLETRSKDYQVFKVMTGNVLDEYIVMNEDKEYTVTYNKDTNRWNCLCFNFPISNAQGKVCSHVYSVQKMKEI